MISASLISWISHKLSSLLFFGYTRVVILSTVILSVPWVRIEGFCEDTVSDCIALDRLS